MDSKQAKEKWDFKGIITEDKTQTIKCFWKASYVFVSKNNTLDNTIRSKDVQIT